MSERRPGIARLALALAVVAFAVALGDVAAAHDCSSPRDCEQTAGYNAVIAVTGGILAVLAGLLGSSLGTAGDSRDGGTAGDSRDGGTAVLERPPGPEPLPPDTIWDPWEKEPLIVWDPAKYGPGDNGQPGQPGWVWWVDNWIPPAEARERIAAGLAADAQRDAEREAFWAESQRISDQWLRDRVRIGQAEAAQERRVHDAERLLDQIRTTAERRDWDDILTRSHESAYNEDGTLDVEYVDGLRDVLRNRIGREMDEPLEPPSHWIVEGAQETWDDARHNPLIRIGAGILTSGTSEVYYQSQSAHEAMQRSFDRAADRAEAQGRPPDWTTTDAFRSGYRALGEENLPVNTYRTLSDRTPESPSASWSEIGTSVAMDAMQLLGLRDTAHNLRGSLNAIRGGQGWRQALTTRVDPPSLFGGAADDAARGADDVARWPGAQYDGPLGLRTRPLRDLPENTPVTGRDFGMREETGWAVQRIVDENPGVEVGFRPTTNVAVPRLREGDLPKGPHLHTKTINDADVALGAPPEHVGRVGYFEPPDEAAMRRMLVGKSPEEIIEIQQRWRQRVNEFQNEAAHMRQLEAEGRITVEGGVVRENVVRVDPRTGARTTTSHYVTGDHDLMWVRYRNPATGQLEQMPKEMYDRVVAQLGDHPAIRTQHPDHLSWRPDLEDPAHRAIDGAILRGHQPRQVPVAEALPADLQPRTIYAPEGPSRIELARAGGGEPIINFSAGIQPRTAYVDPADIGDAARLQNALGARR